MEYVMLLFYIALVILLILFLPTKEKTPKCHNKNVYDERGFDHKRIHRNGTRFDDFGYDYFGYDKCGYNQQGYNIFGKNAKGQYDRFFDTKSYDEEGFLNPNVHPIALSTHARERFRERLGIHDPKQMDIQTMSAYRFGKSKRQIKKSSAYLIEEIEKRHQNSVVLIYRNCIYVFAIDNVLKTLYKNEKISL